MFSQTVSTTCRVAQTLKLCFEEKQKRLFVKNSQLIASVRISPDRQDMEEQRFKETKK